MVQVLDSVEAMQQFINSNPKVVIDLWAPWCAPCKALAPIFEALSAEFTQVAFAKIDVQEVPEAASQFSVRGIPAILGFNNGAESFREAGAKRDPLAAALARLTDR